MPQHYTILALDIPGLMSIEHAVNGLRINNHGLIAGSVYQNEQWIPFIADSQQVKRIPRLHPYTAIVHGINDVGSIVGTLLPNQTMGTRRCGFVLTAHDFMLLDNQEREAGTALTINKQSDILYLCGGWGSYIYQNTRFRALDSANRYRLQAKGMNDGGTVVGSGRLHGQPPFSTGAFVYQDGNITFLPKLALGRIEKRVNVAYAINNRGDIVGMSLGDTEIQQTRVRLQHAFVYTEGAVYDLGTIGSLQSMALAINIHGNIVGYARDPHEREAESAQALLWQQRTCINLNSYTKGSGWSLKIATDINDAGQIVGLGMLHGTMRVFLMTPR